MMRLNVIMSVASDKINIVTLCHDSAYRRLQSSVALTPGGFT